MAKNSPTKIRLATESDLKYIESLSKKETHSIGFIPKVAYKSAITGIKTGKRWSDTCNDKLWIAEENDDLLGFLLMSMGNIAKVSQICLQKDARKLERGRALLDKAMKHAESHNGIWRFGCGCADDLESNEFWKAMGWAKVGDRRGIHHGNTWKESSDRKVNLYRFYKDILFPMSDLDIQKGGDK